MKSILLLLLVIFSACSSPEIYLKYESVGEDESQHLNKLSTILGEESLVDWGNYHYVSNSLAFETPDGDLNYKLITPVKDSIGNGTFVCFVPGLGNSYIWNYPMAANLAENNLSSFLYSYKGDDHNSHFLPTYGVNEGLGLFRALYSYKLIYNIDTLRVSFVASSLGCNITLDALGFIQTLSEEDRGKIIVKSITFLGILENIEETANKILPQKDKKKVEKLLSESNIDISKSDFYEAYKFIPQSTSLLFQWGEEDVLVESEARERIISFAKNQFPKVESEILKDGKHSLVSGNPTNPEATKANYQRIVDYIIEKMK